MDGAGPAFRNVTRASPRPARLLKLAVALTAAVGMPRRAVRSAYDLTGVMYHVDVSASTSGCVDSQ